MRDRTITERNARYRRKLAEQRGLRRTEVFVPEDRVAELKDFARSLREAPAANLEVANDRAKLLYHRMVAQRLRASPDLIRRAQEALDRHPLSESGRAAIGEWRRVLQESLQEICRILVSRSAESKRLRLSSPFPFVDGLRIDDEELRRRMWQVAKRSSKPSKI